MEKGKISFDGETDIDIGFDLKLPEGRRTQAKLAIKDEDTFDFAELSPEYSEHELEMQLETPGADLLPAFYFHAPSGV